MTKDNPIERRINDSRQTRQEAKKRVAQQPKTDVDVGTDDAQKLHEALQGQLNKNPGAAKVSVELDADTAQRLNDAVKDGLTGSGAFVFGEDNPPKQDSQD